MKTIITLISIIFSGVYNLIYKLIAPKKYKAKMTKKVEESLSGLTQYMRDNINSCPRINVNLRD